MENKFRNLLISDINNIIISAIETHAKTKLFEGFVLLSIIISFSVYYLFGKNSITLYILVALLLICSIIISKMMNIFYKLLNSGIISPVQNQIGEISKKYGMLSICLGF